MTDSTTPQELDAILAECLDRVTRGASVDDCLRRYPEYATLLREPLQMAIALRQLKTPVLASARVTALENRLAHQFKTQMKQPRTVMRPSGWQRANKIAAGVVLVLVVTLAGAGGTVAASSNSMPDDTLYGIKRAWENVIAFFAQVLGRANDLWLHLAHVRYDELLYLQAKGELSADDLEMFNFALENALLLADARTTPPLIQWLGTVKVSLKPVTPVAVSPQYQQTVRLLNTQTNPDGVLQLIITPPVATLTPDQTLMASPTVAPTLTPVLTTTLASSPTLTATLTPSATQPLVASATSRFSATATRTPDNAPSPLPTTTPSLVLSATPTSTYTPLPLPALTRPASNTQTPTSTALVGATATPNPNGSTAQSPFVRQTIQAVEMTQTAQPQTTEEP